MTILRKDEEMYEPYTFDISEEAKNRILSEYKLYKLVLGEKWKEYLATKFDEGKIPCRSLNLMLMLIFPEIIATNHILKDDYWIISEKQFDSDKILYFFKQWFRHQTGHEFLGSGEHELKWSTYEPYGKQFHVLPYYIMAQIENKELPIKIIKRSKAGEIVSETSYPIRFIREKPERGISGMVMISNIIIPEDEETAFAFELQLKLDTNPNKEERITFIMRIRRYSNRDLREKDIFRKSSPRINMIHRNYDRPAIKLKIRRKKVQGEYQWVWDDDVKTLTTLSKVLNIKIPKVREAVKFEKLQKPFDSYFYGLIHHTQDSYLHPVNTGISVGEKSTFFSILFQNILEQLGLDRSKSWIRYTNSILKRWVTIPEVLISKMDRTFTKLEKQGNKLRPFQELIDQQTFPKILFLVPKSHELIFEKVLFAFWGERQIYDLKIIPNYFVKGYTEYEKRSYQKKFEQFIEEQTSRYRQKEDLYIVYYMIYEEKYYQFKTEVTDPRQVIRDTILHFKGVPKQISLPKHWKIGIPPRKNLLNFFEEDTKLDSVYSSENTNNDLLEEDGEHPLFSRIITSLYDYYRLVGMPRKNLSELKFKGKNMNYVGLRLYKGGTTLKSKLNLYFIGIIINTTGQIQVYLQNNTPISYLEAYRRIIQKEVQPLQSFSDIRHILKSLFNSYKDEDTIVYIDPNNFLGVRNVIATLSNTHFRKSEFIFSSERTEKLEFVDEKIFNKDDYPLLRLIRVKCQSDDIPRGYVFQGNNYGNGSGLCFQDSIHEFPNQFFGYSVGQKPASGGRTSNYSSKYVRPKDKGWNPSTVEFACIMKPDTDSYRDLFAFSHLLRLVPAVLETEVLRPFPLYLAERLRKDLTDILKLGEEYEEEEPQEDVILKYFISGRI